jgi:hypothetical protein
LQKFSGNFAQKHLADDRLLVHEPHKIEKQNNALGGWGWGWGWVWVVGDKNDLKHVGAMGLEPLSGDINGVHKLDAEMLSKFK